MAELSTLQAASQGLADININLLIKNNRNYPQGVSVMAQGGGTSINANIEFRYNFTSFTFNTTLPYTVIIQTKGRDAAVFGTFQTQVNGYNVEAVVDALNSALISQFNTFTEGGQTYISTYNNKTEFNNLFLVQSLPDNIVDYMVTESGELIVTENGDFLITQDVSTNVFPVEIIAYPTDDPAVLVTVQDGSGGGVTYGEITNSYGLNNYEVQGLYLYSPDIKQLNRPISYSSIDATGNAQVIAIPNVVNPNQTISSSIVDLSTFEGSILLDGLSQVNTVVLPQNSLQMKFLSKQISAKGKLSDNFLDIQESTNTKFFEPPSESISQFDRNEAIITDAIPDEVIYDVQDNVSTSNLSYGEESEEILPQEVSYQTQNDFKITESGENSLKALSSKKVVNKKQSKVEFPKLKKNNFIIAILGIAAIAGFLLLNKKDKD